MRHTGVVLAVAALTGCASTPSRPKSGAEREGTRSSSITPVASGVSPPVAPVHPVVDRYFGQDVVDRYRWMEEPDSPALRGWLTAQDTYARQILSAIPGSAALEARVQALSREVRVVTDLRVAEKSLFFLVRDPGRQKPTLQMRDEAGEVRTLVDIETSTLTSIDYVYPSPRGNYVAYGVSSGGTENAALHVLDVRTGRPATIPIPGCQASSITWLPDESAFYYTRVPPATGRVPARESRLNERVYLCRLSRPEGGDALVFGPGVPGSDFVDPRAHTRILVRPGTHLIVAMVNHAVNDPFALAIGAEAESGLPRVWNQIARPEDGIKQVAFGEGALYVITFKDAPRHRLERWSIDADGVRNREVLFESPTAILEDVAVAKDGIYVTALDSGQSRLFVLRRGAKATEVALPVHGTLADIDASWAREGAIFSLEGWTSPTRWYRSAGRDVHDLGLGNEGAEPFGDVAVTEVEATSHDGTVVPMTLMHRKDIRLDGRNPTWLSAYGAYGISLSPNFRATRKAWLEHGGVFAFAHVRGGGEFGEAWHKAGQKANKMNSILDVIACAEALIQRKVASPETLGIYGGSAGGIVANGAIVKRPDLFAAAVVHAGDVNMVRIEEKAGGPRNAEEFGSVQSQAGFEGLFAMDAYHHVTDGVPYPAVLLSTGMNDPRVPAWQTAKMAARLQAASSSGRPILVRVGFDDGHGVGSLQREEAARSASFYAFMLWRLGGGVDRHSHPELEATK